MTKKLTALAAMVVFLLTQRSHAQASGQMRIYFVDVGQGASTLIVSPTGRTLLVDGGAQGGGTKVAALLTTLGIAAIDYTVVTHYHIDHISGIMELLNAGKVVGTAFDNGDGVHVTPPGTATTPNSTRGTYLNYIAATNRPDVTRQTIQPGQVIDLGGGMRATCIAAGGRLLTGGAAAITNEDLNASSISLLIEYNDFDFLVSGDLTGGGSTSTVKTPDVETYVGQIVGDVDVVQLNHHGSTTTSNQTFLASVRAEVGLAQSGEANTFGHPNREIVNRYLNTPVTNGSTFTPTTAQTPGAAPIFYQNEASPAGDDRVTQQGHTAAAAGHGGQGTILLGTDGSTTYSVASFDDGGVLINGALHVYQVDGASAAVTTDFRPTVIAQTNPVLPLASDSVMVTATVNDRESPISSAVLTYAVNGTSQAPITMTLAGGAYQATIPAQPDGTRVDYAVTATATGQATASSSGYFAGVTPIASLRATNTKGESVYAGYAARVQGTVTASGFSGNTTNDDYIQDAGGAINVYRSTDTPTPFVATLPGQTAEARGRVGFNGGRLRLEIMESIEKTTSPYGVAVMAAGPAPTPVTTTIASINSNPESFEGQLVAIENLSIVSGSIPATPQPFDTFVTVSDGTNSLSLKIDDDTDVEGFMPAATFTAVGIIQQDDFLRPFDTGYNITPRSRVDLGATPPAPAPLLTIADARIDQVNNATNAPGADFIPDRVGQAVKVRGAVTSIDFRGGNGVEYYVQDATGGIDLFSTSLNAVFATGDNVEAIGIVTHFNGLTELTLSSVTPLGGSTATAPEVVTLAQLGNGGAGEAFEGRLVRIDRVLVTAGSFPAANGTGNVTITDATGTGTVRVDSDSNIDGTPTPAGVFSVTGVVGQFAPPPFDSGYQLLPRSLDDIVGTACSAITIAGALPGGTVGVPYAQTLTASGGTGPYTFSVATGTAPGGLTLGADGVLSGVPFAGGTFTFSVRAVAADGCLGVAVYTVTVINLAPVLAASPATVAFGAVALGASSVSSVTLTNTGNASLTLNTLTISGTDTSQFQAGAPATSTLSPGASTTAAVTFAPTTGGAKSATLTIASNGGTKTVELSGNADVPTGGGGIVISEFRTRGPASGAGSGNDEFVEIYNNSDAPIDISGYRLFGSNNTGGGTTTPRVTVAAGVILPARAHYLFVNTTAGTGYSLPVPGNRGWTTGFTDDGGLAIFNASGATPLDAVGMSAGSAFKEGTTLTPLAGAANQSYQRNASGLANTLQDTNVNSADFQLLNGVAPNVPNPQNIVLIGSPMSIDFGGVMPLATLAQPVTVKNVLIASVTLNAPALGGADGSSFSAGPPSTTALAGGATATILVTFQPVSDGARSALLTVTSSNAGAIDILLSGTGLPGISVTPPSIDFGSVPSGETATATVLIANGNPTDVTLTPPFAVTGPDVAEFSAGAPGTTTLAPASDTIATVTFQPASLGNKSASLVVTSTNGGTRTIPLSGISSCPAITVTGTLANAEFGAAYSQALAASGGGGGPFTFAIASGMLPAGVALDPNGTVSGTPTALGPFTFTAEATAANGCTGATPFTVTVADTTKPVLTLPANITTEASGPTTAVNFAVSATDAADASPVVTCAPASGSRFPVATTTVNCTATDAHGNSTPGSFAVTITDHTGPALTLPGNLSASATTPSGAAVSFVATALDLVAGSRPVTCAPASGSTFPIGTTTVACMTSDAGANSTTGFFTVTVTVVDQPGRMIGDGEIVVGAVRHQFGFFVQERANGGDISAIRYRMKTSRRGRDQEDRFDAIAVTGVTFFNVPGVSPGSHPGSGIDTVTFGGTGRWNGRSGYTFNARAIDAGEPGRGHDRFAITVRDGAGQIVASVDALLTGGNVQSLRIRR